VQAVLLSNSPSALSSFAIDATKFSFYLLRVAGFLILVINGLVLIHTQYALKAIAGKITTYPTSAIENLSSIHSETATPSPPPSKPFWANFGPTLSSKGPGIDDDRYDAFLTKTS
jgi:hypothetical protein